MAKINFKGSPVNTISSLPQVGDQAPDFSLTANDLSEKSLKDFKGKKIILNIFPSIDTGTCATSVRKFNAAASELKDTIVLCISKDLPFAQSRFCGAEGLNNVVTLSNFRDDRNFEKNYGVGMIDGPLKGLDARSVVIIDQEGKVTYTELVNEIADEPDYDVALKSLG